MSNNLIQIREAPEGIWLVFINEDESGKVEQFGQLLDADEALNIGKALVHVAETFTGAMVI